MKTKMLLPVAALLLAALCAPHAAAHECKVVCDAAHPSPVCGSDGKTYASECFLEFAKCATPSLTLAHDHACPPKTKSTTIHISVNKKDHAVEDDEKDRADDDDDESEDDDKCEKDCSRELEQLCASDGKTYNNHCLYEIALCKNPKLTVINEDGACPATKETRDADDDDESEEGDDDDDDDDKEATCQKGCSRELEQLCASDGKTYNNHCLYEIALCINPKLTIVDADGACPTKPRGLQATCVKDCTRELAQMCASDGKTYNNQCLFENARCSNSSLTVVNADGPCK